MLRHTSRFDNATCHPPPRSQNHRGKRPCGSHIVVTSAKKASRVITPENARVDVLATVTLNTLVPERAIVAARLVSSANDNLRATEIAIASTVYRRIVTCRTGKISAHEHPSTFLHSRSSLWVGGSTRILHFTPRRCWSRLYPCHFCPGGNSCIRLKPLVSTGFRHH